MAMMQAISRANLDLPFRSASMYYMSVTAHGVLMGAGVHHLLHHGRWATWWPEGDRPDIKWPSAGLGVFWLALAGTVMALATVFAFKSSVLYTFYPPLQAHPLFYIGLTLLVVGSWGGRAASSRRGARRAPAHPDRPVSLAMHATSGERDALAARHRGRGLGDAVPAHPLVAGTGADRIDPVLARTLFWYFGHPLVYFWVLPAYAIWYTVLPREAGGKLFSEPLGRMVFTLFLILSTPVGFHHQFQDPGIPAIWKLFHTFNTMIISFPSLVTAFTIVASLEVAGRLRGGTGLFGWIRALPWGNPVVSSVLLACLLFMVGGFGGAVNAAYALNSVVHNTAWIAAHFHLTVGSAVGAHLHGRCLLAGTEGERPRARAQACWRGCSRISGSLGMALFCFTGHIAGLLGLPRRVFATNYGGAEQANAWEDADQRLRARRHRAVCQRQLLRAGHGGHAAGGRQTRRSRSDRLGRVASRVRKAGMWTRNLGPVGNLVRSGGRAGVDRLRDPAVGPVAPDPVREPRVQAVLNRGFRHGF